MQARLSAFLVWALVAAGVMFWALRLIARPAPLPSNVLAVDSRVAAGGDFVRMFGAAPVAESAAPAPIAQNSRFKLLGVLAPAGVAESGLHSQGGVALISTDDKPAKPYVVGAPLDDGLILQSVARRSASIGPVGGAASVVLELPPPAPPATGTLPMARPDGEGAAPQQHMPAPAQVIEEQAEPASPVPSAPHGDGQRNRALR